MNKELRRNVAIAILSAIVIVLQLLPIKFGTFQMTLALIPIVIGGILYGPFAGGYLGFMMAMTILINGDASVFLAISPVATFVTVILKSTLAGVFSSLLYRLLSKKSEHLATWVACISAPVINTGLFALGCLTLFGHRLVETFAADNIFVLTFVGFIGINFFIELAVSCLLASGVIYLVRLLRQKLAKGEQN